jgi:hypothetical protein
MICRFTGRAGKADRQPARLEPIQRMNKDSRQWPCTQDDMTAADPARLIRQAFQQGLRAKREQQGLTRRPRLFIYFCQNERREGHNIPPRLMIPPDKAFATICKLPLIQRIERP